MIMESPLFLSRVECPVCGTINEFETIRVGAYTEGERMTDFCPSFIKWRNPKYQKYHPLLFFAVTCSNCHYTREFNSKYKEWAKDNNFRAYRQKAIRDKHLSQLATEMSFLRLAGGALDREQYPDESAILKLLLAAYEEQLNDHPSDLDLGRFYLRVAWMFRRQSAGQEKGQEAPPPDHLDDIERAVGDLRNWLGGLGRNLDYLRSAVDAYGDHQAPSETEGESFAERYQVALAGAVTWHEAGKEMLSQFESCLADSRRAPDQTPSSSSSSPFREYPSFDEFLQRLAQVWNGVPRTEFEAMKAAVKHYIVAFETGKEISRGNQSLQAAYLIAELSRQIGDTDCARQYFNTTIKMGQEFINEIKGDRVRTALARKILELAMAQGKKNLAQVR